MPLEGHWRRQRTPLRSTSARERAPVAIVAALTAAALGALVYFLVVGGDSAAPAAGCVKATVPSTTGGADVSACGRAAVRLCSQALHERTPPAAELRRQCRQRRIGGPPR